MDGEVQIELGKSHDSGLIYIDSNGVPRIVYKAFVDFGALPNATTKDVAHGLADVDVEYATVSVVANDGTTSKMVDPADVTVDATNVSVTAAGDESAFAGKATIEYIKTIA